MYIYILQLYFLIYIYTSTIIYKIFVISNRNIPYPMQSLSQKIKNNPKVTLGVVIPVLLGLYIRAKQHKLIYIPQYLPQLVKSPASNPLRYRNPAAFGLPNYHNIQIQSADGIKLRGWYISSSDHYTKSNSKRLILYYHQNAGNIGLRLPFIAKLVHMTESDVMIVAYRGYSDSQGKPTEAGIKKDGIAILNKAIQQATTRKLPLVVYGRSLGGAVAIHSVANINQQLIKGLILQNTFTSISDVALHLFTNRFTKPIFKPLLYFLLTHRWQSIKLINKISVPTYFVKSVLDQMIPIAQMNELQKRSISRNIMEYSIQFGTHNDTWSTDEKEYFKRLNQFVAKL